jgi:cbb3-type cytochrome oxidase subunit 3
MDKKLLIVLLMVFLVGFVIMGLNLTVDMFSWGAGAMITLALIIVLIIVLLWLINPFGRNSEGETETIRVDTDATIDSRICEKTTSFIGIPFFLVFGSVWGKYESIFSVEHEGKNVVVTYPGICLVSKNDKLRIIGKLYNGNKVRTENNVIIASRVENMSSGIVFNTGK